jgi:4-hydroxybenzoate polyprenyltransferase
MERLATLRAVATLKAYLDLCRVSNLPTVWTNVLAACVLATGRFSAGSTLLAAVSLSCFYLAGMVLNDLYDTEFDRESKPSRPIPSGRISVHHAKLFTLLLFACGFVVLAMAAHRSAAFAALLLVAAIVAYDRHHKQNPYSVLLISSCRFLVYVVAALAVSGRLPSAVVLAGSLQFGYIVILSLTARYENARSSAFPFPVIPVMLAGISLLDGMVLGVLVDPVWLWAGIGGFLMTLAGQRYVRGD